MSRPSQGVLLLLFGLASGTLLANAEGPTQGLTLEIRVDPRGQRPGGPVFVECRITNRSDEAVQLPVLFLPNHHFVSFQIVDPEGQVVRFSGPERKEKIDDSVVFELRPRMFAGQFVDVTGSVSSERWYPIDGPGTYRVRARYLVPAYLRRSFPGRGIWTGTLVSNEENFRIEVEPPGDMGKTGNGQR